MGFGPVPELQRYADRAVVVVVTAVAEPTRRPLCAAGSFGRGEYSTSIGCARWCLLLEITVGPPPECEIAGEEGAVGGMTSGEVDVVTSSAVPASVESARPGY